MIAITTSSSTSVNPRFNRLIDALELRPAGGPARGDMPTFRLADSSTPLSVSLVWLAIWYRGLKC